MTSDGGRVVSPRCILIACLLLSASMPALAADPLTLYILRMLRDQMISATLEAGASASQQPSGGPASAPVVRADAPPPEGQWLKALIDESFTHLGPQQREELYNSLTKMLSDPRNAEFRADVLAEFTRQATAIREAHRVLAKLTEADMKRVAVDARGEFERLPPEQRQQLVQALRQGLPGMPRALQDMMLAEFNSVPASR